MTLSLISINGRTIRKNVGRFRIKWNGHSRSNFQFAVKRLLEPVWVTDIVFEEFPVYGSLMKVDFYNATKQIAVEANGTQHDKYNPFFHNGSRENFVAGVTRDLKKYSWLEQNGITLVEYVEADIKDIKAFYHRLYS